MRIQITDLLWLLPSTLLTGYLYCRQYIMTKSKFCPTTVVRISSDTGTQWDSLRSSRQTQTCDAKAAGLTSHNVPAAQHKQCPATRVPAASRAWVRDYYVYILKKKGDYPIPVRPHTARSR